MHEGHRKRMLARLAEGGKMEEHELLEILLYNAIPRKNTNEIAHGLLSAFGTVEAVLQAGEEALMQVPGVGAETAAYLSLIGLFYARLRESGTSVPRIYNLRGFNEFLGKRFAGKEEEIAELYCMDAQQHISLNKRFTSHSPGHVDIDFEELSRAVLSVHPVGVVFAHNHPHAPCHPSAKDDAFTAQMAMFCSMYNIHLYDHIIVGEDGVYSYFMLGKMDEIRREFSVASLIEGRRPS